jgi:putative N-acetyltransferase (TIGR04045 family)
MNAPLPGNLRLLVPRDYRIVHADAAGKAAAQQLRRAVFCHEQGLFDGDDTDAIDPHALTLVAYPAADATPPGDRPVVGTVRIHQCEPGTWQGSRLAVASEFRRVGVIGAALIQLAVRSAHTFGCRRFIAQVQAANVRMFQRLHWHSLGTTVLHGQPHHVMAADLAHYPAFAPDEPLQVDVHRGRS